METLKLIPIAECGGSRRGTLSVTYKEIVEKIFEPNTTEIDDPDKVKASWGFQDESGRRGFVWYYEYYGKKETCISWSVDGDKSLLTELFGDKVELH